MSISQNSDISAEELSPTTTTDTTDTTSTEISPEQVIEKLGIPKSSYYEWMKFLSEKAEKDNGRAYLTEKQIERLTRLKDWKDKNGKLQGFLEQENSDRALALINEAEQSGSLEEQRVLGDEVDLSEQRVLGDESRNLEDKGDVLLEEAQRLVVRRRTYRNEVVAALADSMSEDDLDPQYQAQIKARSSAVNFPSPQTVASKILSQWRSSKN